MARMLLGGMLQEDVPDNLAEPIMASLAQARAEALEERIDAAVEAEIKARGGCFLDCPLCSRATDTESPYHIHAAFSEAEAARVRREALEEAARVCDDEAARNVGDDPREFSARICADLIRALAADGKP